MSAVLCPPPLKWKPCTYICKHLSNNCLSVKSMTYRTSGIWHAYMSIWVSKEALGSQKCSQGSYISYTIVFRYTDWNILALYTASIDLNKQHWNIWGYFSNKIEKILPIYWVNTRVSWTFKISQNSHKL